MPPERTMYMRVGGWDECPEKQKSVNRNNIRYSLMYSHFFSCFLPFPESNFTPMQEFTKKFRIFSESKIALNSPLQHASHHSLPSQGGENLVKMYVAKATIHF